MRAVLRDRCGADDLYSRPNNQTLSKRMSIWFEP